MGVGGIEGEGWREGVMEWWKEGCRVGVIDWSDGRIEGCREGGIQIFILKKV